MAEELNFQKMVKSNIEDATKEMGGNIRKKLEKAIDEERLPLVNIGKYFKGMHRRFLVFSSIF